MNQENDQSQLLTPEVQAYYDDKKLFHRNAFWLLFGNFAMGLGLGVCMLIPLHMDRVGMNATQISLGFSINGWLIAFLMIYISYRSDNCQIRWGRRLPFLLLSILPVCLSLVLFPHTKTILTCVLVFAIYRFFINFKEQTYPFLSYDIARKEYWGRSWALQMAGGMFGAWLANVGLMRLVSRWGEANVFYLAAAMLCLLTLTTVLFLKEPPIRVKNPPPFKISNQLRIGFSDKRNWLLFIGFGFCGVATMPTMQFAVLQAKKNIMLNEAQIGMAMSWAAIAAMLMTFPAGLLTDKLGAIRTTIIGFSMIVAASFFGYNAHTSFQLSIAMVLLVSGGILTYNATLVFLVHGIPRAIIASFSACNGMFCAFFAATMQLVCGCLIDYSGGNYSLAFPFGAILGGGGIIMLIIVGYLRNKSAETELASLNPEFAKTQ
ncbi:MAG: MFS transporter [Phycisphaerae bacterium]